MLCPIIDTFCKHWCCCAGIFVWQRCYCDLCCLTSWGTDVEVQRCLFSSQFWDGKQNFIPNMWQVVFANIPVKSRVINSDVNGFFDGSSYTMSLLPIILKFSTDVVWPVALLCSNIVDGAFKCSLYLSSKVLADSPMYSSSHSVLPHLHQYMMLLCFLIPSLSFGNISKFFRVFPPWSMHRLHTCYRWTCSFHIGLCCKVLLCDICSMAVWCFCLGLFCFFSVFVLSMSC